MRVLDVLLACEESQEVTKEFRLLGHNAFSCDLKDCSGGKPEWHIKGDAIQALYSRKWDIVIAFPPCTHLAVSGAKHFHIKRKDGRQKAAIDFFMKFARYPGVIAIENPVGIMSTVWREPDQIIQPWEFGDSFQKTTCLWLKGLPPLKPTKIVDPGEFVITPSGKKLPKWYSDNKSSQIRSKTFPGIAKAMADQWSAAERVLQGELFS